jgi:hypothetical protein
MVRIDSLTNRLTEKASKPRRIDSLALPAVPTTILDGHHDNEELVAMTSVQRYNTLGFDFQIDMTNFKLAQRQICEIAEEIRFKIPLTHVLQESTSKTDVCPYTSHEFIK